LEALSRGAKEVVFVEDFKPSLETLQTNIRALHVESQAHVISGKIPSVLARIIVAAPFELVFVDPPYDKGLIDPTLKSLATNKLIDAQSWVVVEHSPREKPIAQGFGIKDERHYGQTWLTFLCLK
jgi:16S rRNA (guanine966-N2)-methyltransferase